MKKAALLIIVFLFYMNSFALASLQDEAIEMEFNQDTISATLRDAPLEKVLEKLSKEKGLRFECGQAALDSRISVQFKNLSLEKGIKRILANVVDYSLYFDKKGNLTGGVIVSKGSGVAPVSQLKSYPQGFRVIRNSPPPGGTVTLTAEQRETFKIIKNSPPPGGTYKLEDLPAEEREKFRIIRNSPPGSDRRQRITK